jgi:ubiquitin-like modifier-activating enzyme 5
MNESITSTNPYSRLIALSKLGVVDDFARIRDKSVVIVGIGGIGAVAAEMLTRCGIGKLHLFDYDTVELANMNRMFYLPNQVGLSKVEAAKVTLGTINPDVEIRGHSVNVCSVAGYAALKNATQSADLLLCCVDNYTARLTVNRVCLETERIWMESGVSESAVSGHIQTMIPGKSACFECAAPVMVAEGTSETKREGVCAASLPTTMSIIAGLLVQNALKFLLGFGKVTSCLGYDALNDFFPEYPLLPNPHCSNPICVGAQNDEEEVRVPVKSVDRGVGECQNVQHEDNSWGIEVVENVPAHDVEKESRQPKTSPQLTKAELIAKLRNRQ